MSEEKDFKKFDIPKPVSVGENVDVTVESVGGQGDGIAKINGFVIFVKGATKGENCKIKITEVKRTYALGEKVGAAEAKPAEDAEEKPEETAEKTEEVKEEKPAEEAPAEAPEN